MYVIEIFDKVHPWSDKQEFIGYYTSLYNIGGPEAGKFVGSAKISYPEDGFNIYLFKTEAAAKNKIAKLELVKQRNLHLSNMIFMIAELNEEDLDKILKAKERHKTSKTKREITYTGVSTSYLKELLQMLKDQMDLDLPLTEQYKLRGKIELVEQILRSLN